MILLLFYLLVPTILLYLYHRYHYKHHSQLQHYYVTAAEIIYYFSGQLEGIDILFPRPLLFHKTKTVLTAGQLATALTQHEHHDIR